jgi:hypothetical protein
LRLEVITEFAPIGCMALFSRLLFFPGVAPGPVYKRLLDAVREGQLEGTITTPQAARELVDRMLEVDGLPPR